MAFLADRLIAQAGNIVQLTEPLTSDTTDYTLGTDHALYDAEIVVAQAPAAEAYAVGTATFGEDIDYASAQAYVGTRSVQRDVTSTTPATAAATAVAHRRQLQLDQDAGPSSARPCAASSCRTSSRSRPADQRHRSAATRAGDTLALGHHRRPLRPAPHPRTRMTRIL